MAVKRAAYFTCARASSDYREDESKLFIYTPSQRCPKMKPGSFIVDTENQLIQFNFHLEPNSSLASK
jgi:hypothetical protein